MDARNVDDYQLFQRLIDGDPGAFDSIYDRYWHRLYHLVYKILQDRAASEDIVQDTFVKFWEKRDTVKNENVLGYLSTISYHLLLKTLKKENTKDRFARTLARTAPHSVNDVDHYIDLADLQANISSCVETLPHQCQTIYRLSREQHQSVNEIASSLQLHPKTVENQITIALKRLRRIVGLFF